MRKIFAIVAVLALAVVAAAQQPSDDALVRQTVETYLHGLKFNDDPRTMDLGLLYRALSADQVDMVG